MYGLNFAPTLKPDLYYQTSTWLGFVGPVSFLESYLHGYPPSPTVLSTYAHTDMPSNPPCNHTPLYTHTSHPSTHSHAYKYFSLPEAHAHTAPVSSYTTCTERDTSSLAHTHIHRPTHYMLHMHTPAQISPTFPIYTHALIHAAPHLLATTTP